MLLPIVLLSVFLYPIDNLKIGPPYSAINEPRIPADISKEQPSKNDEQPVAIEGRFIIAEGNSDHLFRPYDFVKEEAIQLGEGDTKDTEKNDKVRSIEGHFISYENDSDEFTK